MAHRSALIATDIDAYLRQQERKGWLRFITCGSVDDGKSTLIGRLLYESRLIHEDHLAQLAVDSARVGTRGGDLDLALLVDGLAAEREQGITIDVAYRYFSTEKRKFIVADTPGHEQYTRNMATGASTADVAVILVDARKGVLTQTRRHSHVVALLGLRHVLVAVNKMDLVGFDEATFERIRSEYAAFAARVGLADVRFVPISAVDGDNVVARSDRMPWHRGPTLLEYLESVEIDRDTADGPFRFPVQWVIRPDQDFRGLAGTVAGGRVRPGDRVRVLPSGRESHVARIVTYDGDLAEAEAGRSVTLTLKDPLDVGRGDLVVAADAPAACADQWQATVIWMHEQPLLPGRTYLAKLGPRTVPATVTELRHRVAVDTLEYLAAKQLELNEIGVCNLSLAAPMPFDSYADNRDTGGFILIDRASCETVGAGLVHFALRRADNVHWQALAVDRAARAALKHQRPCVLWFTGLSGAGKSTIANLVEKRLHALGRHTYLLDGDNVRHGLNRDLGFTDPDRVENVRRVAEVAKLMADAGLIVLVSFISPFRAERRMARDLLAPGEFVEVHVDVPLAEAERRDPKGLYAKARRGELRNFTGLDSPYEPPESPELRIDAAGETPDAAAERIVDLLERRTRDR
jgi:bifunctional enzyme CysN/CysC